MAVQLDDGRSVAFDVKDYAAIDHGYAATIHKAQGVTVDRVHVLATPGLDRHAAYVALSRHRDGVDLHYGHDDFADQRQLVRALSRDRGKDMASDYAEQQAAERDKTAEPARQPGRFAGLRLTPAGPAAEPIATPLDKAVERFARATADIAGCTSRGCRRCRISGRRSMPPPKTLDAVQPEAARDLTKTLAARPELLADAAKGRTTAAMRAMTLEAEVRIDLGRRADRFVADWQRQAKLYATHDSNRDYDAADGVREAMNGMAKSLARDPQLESLLRNRVKELGIGTSSGASLSHELQQGRTRSRGDDLSL